MDMRQISSTTALPHLLFHLLLHHSMHLISFNFLLFSVFSFYFTSHIIFHFLCYLQFNIVYSQPAFLSLIVLAPTTLCTHTTLAVTSPHANTYTHTHTYAYTYTYYSTYAPSGRMYHFLPVFLGRLPRIFSISKEPSSSYKTVKSVCTCIS